MGNIEKNTTVKGEKEITVKELSKLWGLPLDITINCICHCDLLYGYVCEYHMNPNIKKTAQKWQDLVPDSEYLFSPEKFPTRKARRNINKNN